MSSIATPRSNRVPVPPWLRIAVPLSHALRRLPGMGQIVDRLRYARLRHLAKKSPERMTRYELDQLTAMAVQHRIIAGPFEGMRYLKQAHGSVLSAKLLGTYESELHQWWSTVLQKGFTNIWVIGSGEGYYAVGLARRMTKAKIFAFDTDPDARSATHDLALLNEVADRVTIAGVCSATAIANSNSSPTLIVCDIEGGERELFTSLPATRFSHCEIIVEVHDTPPATDTFDELLSHFAQSHHALIETATTKNDNAVDWPAGLESPRLRERLLREGRFRGNRWIYFAPRSSKELR